MAQHAADHGAVEIGGIVDVADHQATYNGFLTLLKYCVIGIAVLLALMAFFLA
jgi:aa3 type cytochrome c oxidase subunit IV